MDSCKPVGTPLMPKTELSKTDGTALTAEEAVKYREITGSLLYLMTCTRRDIAVAVNQLSRHMAAPTSTHMQAAKRVLRYLRGTAATGLVYTRSTDKSRRNLLTSAGDASWRSVNNSKSVSGYVVLFNGAAVSWRCKVQPIVALSTAEAEFDALTAVAREVVYLRELLRGMYCPQEPPTTILQDNQPCIAMVNNPVTSIHNKHFAMRFAYIRQLIAEKAICVSYCATSEMIADALTKPLPVSTHENLFKHILGTRA